MVLDLYPAALLLAVTPGWCCLGPATMETPLPCLLFHVILTSLGFWGRLLSDCCPWISTIPFTSKWKSASFPPPPPPIYIPTLHPLPTEEGCMKDLNLVAGIFILRENCKSSLLIFCFVPICFLHEVQEGQSAERGWGWRRERV